MTDLAKTTVLETNKENEKSLLDAIKEGYHSTKVGQADLQAIRDLAAETGIKSYKDVVTMKSIKPRTNIEKFVLAKINKMKDVKKVSAFIGDISRAETQEEMASALGVPVDKLHVLIPSADAKTIFVDLSKKFLLFTASMFIFKVSLMGFKSLSGVKEILSKCASHKREIISSAAIYHQIKKYGSPDLPEEEYEYLLEEDDLTGGSEVPDFEMDPAEEFEIIDEVTTRGAEELAKKVQVKMVENALVENGMSVSEAAKIAPTYDGDADVDKLEQLHKAREGLLSYLQSPASQNAPVEVAQENGQKWLKLNEEIQELETRIEGHITPAEVEEIKQVATEKSFELVTDNQPASIHNDPSGMQITFAEDMASDEKIVEMVAQSEGKQELKEVVQEYKKVLDQQAVQDNIPDIGQAESGGYNPGAVECSALNFASYGFVKILLKFFQKIASGVFAVFSDFGLPALLASVVTSMVLLGEGVVSKFTRIVDTASSFVKEKALGVWDYITGRRRLKLSSVMLSASSEALPQEAYSKISLNMTEFVKEKAKELMGHLSTRSVKKMRSLAQDVGVKVFKDISSGKEIKPSNKVESLVKRKMESLSDPSKQFEFVSAVADVQNVEELASLLGVTADELDESYQGVVNTRGWDYTMFIGKTFLFALFCGAVFLAVATYLGGTSVLVSAGGAKTAAFISALQAKLAPLSGVFQHISGGQSVGAVFSQIAKSSVISGAISTSIAGLVLYGPQWIRNVLSSIKDWVSNKVMSIFNSIKSVFSFKSATANPNTAMRYLLTA